MCVKHCQTMQQSNFKHADPRCIVPNKPIIHCLIPIGSMYIYIYMFFPTFTIQINHSCRNIIQIIGILGHLDYVIGSGIGRSSPRLTPKNPDFG